MGITICEDCQHVRVPINQFPCCYCTRLGFFGDYFTIKEPAEQLAEDTEAMEQSNSNND